MTLTMRRKPVPRPDPGNWQHQDVGGSNGLAGVAFRRGRKANPVRAIRAISLPGLGIVDNFPEHIPVSQRELDVIETYAGISANQSPWRESIPLRI
jgi:hypothetical protein